MSGYYTNVRHDFCLPCICVIKSVSIIVHLTLSSLLLAAAIQPKTEPAMGTTIGIELTH